MRVLPLHVLHDGFVGMVVVGKIAYRCFAGRLVRRRKVIISAEAAGIEPEGFIVISITYLLFVSVLCHANDRVKHFINVCFFILPFTAVVINGFSLA